ncbi:hypothetical protein DFH11DRAFT_410765 [Phellopilus nigrolimitatus]|nr:hypothetical protein DFH11DRAFT_410765 [Phellopilus nigrolimitatus]
MPPSKRDRRLVMDLDSAPASSIHSCKSSLSLNDKVSLPSPYPRRSSASQIIPIVSQGLFVATANGLKRSPLAPLDPQFSSTFNLDSGMAHEGEYQAGRKASSITLTNATRPTPYSQRNLPRRPLPGQQRRTSLPALHPSVDSPAPPLPNPVSPYELAVPPHDEDADIYSRLSTFTFGDAQAPQLQPSASSSSSSSSSRTIPPTDDADTVSPLHRVASFDKTPRPSVAYANARLQSVALSKPNGWSSPSEDEEERRRTNTRSKIRAIDDGMRRPSLPGNDHHPLSLSGLSATDKGKGKAPSEDEKGRQGTVLSSPLSQTEIEGGLELDTDVDLMSVDDIDRRRRVRDHETSNRSSMFDDGRIRIEVGSMHGDNDEYGRAGECESRDENAMDEDENSCAFHERTGRRGSLPMDIPNYSYPGRTASRAAHQDDTRSTDFDARALAHAQLRRPSRSVDDDLQRAALHLQRKASRVSVAASGAPGSLDSSGGSGGGATPSSEPDMRGVAMAQAIAQAHLDAQMEGGGGPLAFGSGSGPAGSSDEPYQGLDLDYILSVSGPMGGSGGASGGAQQLALDLRGSDTWNGRMSVGSSVAARDGRDRDANWAEGWGVNYAVGRRQSTATVNDDTFLRFVKKHDYSYDERKREWTFARERVERTLEEPRLGQEIWRCLWVGRYRVDRIHSKTTDTSKPLQTRLNIRHLPDAYSKADTYSGPLTFIHKHSRAQAFSIFRGHALPQRHLKTSSSILLAPKKVQEQFTSTRTTSKLSTYGLLEEKTSTEVNVSGSGRSGQTASGSTSNSATTSTTSVSGSSRVAQSSATSKGSSTDREMPSSPQNTGKLKVTTDKPAEAVDRKGKGVMRSPIVSTPTSVQTSMSEMPTPLTDKVASDVETPHPHRRASREPPFEHPHRNMEVENRPVSSIAERSSMTSEGSQQFSSALSAWDQSSIGSSRRDSRRPSDLRQHAVRLPTVPRGSVGSLEEQPIRTSHAEAFAALDPPFIEYLRTHSSNYDDFGQDSQPSRFRGLRKLFHTQPVKSASKHSPLSSSSSVAVLEGHYTPPWLTMAARSKQEEQERVIKNLNDSFRDVGLLPSFKPNRTRANKKGKRASDNVFDQIPDESLYMLLPMWPGETDPQSVDLSDDPAAYDIPLHERQYLLVYYVPNELNKEKPEDKKRSRGSQTSSATSHHSATTTSREIKNTVELSSFNVLARLVSYKDVNGSGIRVPTNGLSVSGPMIEAMLAIPQIRFQVDDLALMIAFCANRERGVEVVPEGAEKLGLCLPRTSPDPDSDAPLSPLGRAAVEMAWLGALAVMGFGNVA